MSTAAADNTAALQKILDYCRERKPARVIFSSGTYRLSGSVRIEQLENLDIDGNGALFLYYRDLKGAKENFSFRNCRQVRIRNLNFDWDWDKMPLGSLVEVINVNGDEIDFRFCDYDYFPKRDLRVAMVSEMDPKTRLVTVENKAVFHFEFYLGQYVPETRWLSGNVLRVKDRGEQLEPGTSLLLPQRTVLPHAPRLLRRRNVPGGKLH
ncbi:MAG: glycoside hydrolase family 55 protein [Lentisphaeria bacterium]|nr:MAG: glycoside hydrolase family 55 protein [Lentisphaeria bacterium]